MVNQILDNCLNQHIIVYLDDVLIYLITLDNYKKHVQRVLNRLFERQLCCKPEKCEFHKKKVVFLGFLVGREDIKMDSSKIEKVIDWPQLRNLKKLQRFLGFGNFNYWFIKNYSLVILSLIELIKKNI